MDPEHKEEQPALHGRIKSLLVRGAEVTGGTAGTALGFLIGGPGGALAGAAASPLLVEGIKRVIGDVADRMLSSREQDRLGAGAFHAVIKISERLEAGDQLSNTAILDNAGGSRAPLDEILEGVLLTCRSTFEEKKLPFVANILPNSLFVEVEPETVHFVLQLAERLTYQEICVAAILGKKHQLNFDTRLLAPSMHLDKDQLVGLKRRTPLQMRKAAITKCIYAIGDNYPGMVSRDEGALGPYQLSDFGRVVFKLMGLEGVPEPELLGVQALLRTVECESRGIGDSQTTRDELETPDHDP